MSITKIFTSKSSSPLKKSTCCFLTLSFFFLMFSVSFFKISVNFLIYIHVYFLAILLITEITKGLSLLYVFPTEFCPWKFISMFFSLEIMKSFIGLYLWEFWDLKCFLWERICYFPFTNLDVMNLALHYAITAPWGFLDHADYVNSNHNPFWGWLWFQNVRTHTHTHTLVWSLCQKKNVFFILPVFCSPVFFYSTISLRMLPFKFSDFKWEFQFHLGALSFVITRPLKHRIFGNWDGWMPPWQQWHKCQLNKLVFTSLLTFGL